MLFESSDALIATVTADGKVSFRNAGTVTITVKSAGNPAIKVAVEVTVKAKEVKPATIEFDAVPSADKTVVGGKYTLFVTVMPSNATNQNVLFASSDETVAKVDENGRITFLKAGKVTITATAPRNREAEARERPRARKAAAARQAEWRGFARSRLWRRLL